MRMSSKFVGASLAALGALSLCTFSGTAMAGSITQPGEIVGYSWAPLPQGLYFADTGSYGNDRGAGYNAELGVNIPVIVWSTPWDFLGGHVEAYAAVPSVALGLPGAGYVSAIYNPALLVGEAWNLGNGFSISDFVGGYAPVNNALNQDNWTFNERLGVTYSMNGFTLTGHVVYGITGNSMSNSFTNPVSGFNEYGQHVMPDYVNLDLTAVKAFGKYSLGVVGFGSWDVSGAASTLLTGRQSQFAVGAMGGYDFGPVILQSYLTRDVLSQGYYEGGVPGAAKIYETRFWVRVIVPLWNPPAPPAPVLAKY
ncbi:transporter [Methylovirgula sp. HY1]|uniref:transporter n=1 Tax=Methylovirgula sp. HY1 TaxID=2822761 RepID=UPI001C5BAB1A|nr:transporter [Methylovirgula sp. HY1]QXX75249.1 hypothetical protein MHY1_02068 [Methylovirgula sp. HY1]